MFDEEALVGMTSTQVHDVYALDYLKRIHGHHEASTPMTEKEELYELAMVGGCKRFETLPMV